MPIKIIRKSGSDLARLEWTFKITRGGSKANETFKLVHNRCISEFNLTCTYEVIEGSGNKISVSVSLIKILSTAINKYNKPNSDEVPDYCHHQLRSVSITRFFDSLNSFELDIPSGTWKSKPFNYWLSSCDRSFFSLPQPPLDPWSWNSATILLDLSIELKNSFCRDENIPIIQMTDMFLQQTDCDVHFTFGEGKRIGSHLNILAAKSPVFAAMFQHEMTEFKTGIVSILDIEMDVFREFLYFIYSGRIINPLTKTMVQSLYLVADKYDVRDMREECIDFIISHIRTADVIQLMVWGYIHSVDRVQEAALTFAAQHGRKVCRQDDWEILLYDYPELCLVATRRMIK